MKKFFALMWMFLLIMSVDAPRTHFFQRPEIPVVGEEDSLDNKSQQSPSSMPSSPQSPNSEPLFSPASTRSPISSVSDGSIPGSPESPNSPEKRDNQQQNEDALKGESQQRIAQANFNKVMSQLKQSMAEKEQKKIAEEERKKAAEEARQKQLEQQRAAEELAQRIKDLDKQMAVLAPQKFVKRTVHFDVPEAAYQALDTQADILRRVLIHVSERYKAKKAKLEEDKPSEQDGDILERKKAMQAKIADIDKKIADIELCRKNFVSIASKPAPTAEDPNKKVFDLDLMDKNDLDKFKVNWKDFVNKRFEIIKQLKDDGIAVPDLLKDDATLTAIAKSLSKQTGLKLPTEKKRVTFSSEVTELDARKKPQSPRASTPVLPVEKQSTSSLAPWRMHPIVDEKQPQSSVGIGAGGSLSSGMLPHVLGFKRPKPVTSSH